MDTIIDTLLDQHSDHISTKTSSSDFLQSLQAFLNRNQIEFVGPFQMRVDPTSEHSSTLLVMGKASNQAGLGYAQSRPNPLDDIPAREMTETRASPDRVSGSISTSGLQLSSDGDWDSFFERDMQVDHNELSQMTFYKPHGNS